MDFRLSRNPETSISRNIIIIEGKKIKVCLDYHIKKCQGPCEGFVQQEKYGKMILLVVDFLKGKNKQIRQKVKKIMDWHR